MRTPPHTGPTMPMRRMAMGMNLAILCCLSVARDSRAAGRWKTREETAAHRNTPYHISAGTHHHTPTNQLIPQCKLFTAPHSALGALNGINHSLFIYLNVILTVWLKSLYLIYTPVAASSTDGRRMKGQS